MQRNANRRELQLRNINLLGGRCRICNTSEKLEVHHRWYTSADKGTHGEHDSMKNLIKMEPKRFACLCHRCNVFVGHIYKNIVNKTYDILIDEAEKMMEGRENYSDDTLTQRHVLKRQIKCAVCEKIMSVSGRHPKKFCSSECKLADRRKNRKAQQHPTLKILNCVMCSETFQITTGKQITCSPKCRMRRVEEIRTQQNLQQKETCLKKQTGGRPFRSSAPRLPVSGSPGLSEARTSGRGLYLRSSYRNLHSFRLEDFLVQRVLGLSVEDVFLVMVVSLTGNAPL